MRRLNLEPSEIIRRFLISSAFESSHVIIISPIKHLVALRRVAFYPYTRGETPWMTVCDLSKFADAVVATATDATDRNGLLLTCKLAECSTRYDHRLRLHLLPKVQTLILISDREAVRDGILISAAEEMYKDVVAEAEEVIKKSKMVDYGMYLELLDRARC